MTSEARQGKQKQCPICQMWVPGRQYLNHIRQTHDRSYIQHRGNESPAETKRRLARLQEIRDELKQFQPPPRQPQPKRQIVILQSKRGKRLETPAECDECRKTHELVWRYSRRCSKIYWTLAGRSHPSHGMSNRAKRSNMGKVKLVNGKK